MTTQSKTTKPSSLLSELHVPLLILGAFLLGAGGMWLIMRSSAPGRPGNPPVERLPPSPATEPPNVSQRAPADAARIFGDWNYDRHNWAHAIEHYQEAIADGADDPDVRTDLAIAFASLANPTERLSNIRLPDRKHQLHDSLFRIQRDFMPKCYTMINMLWRLHTNF